MAGRLIAQLASRPSTVTVLALAALLSRCATYEGVNPQDLGLTSGGTGASVAAAGAGHGLASSGGAESGGGTDSQAGTETGGDGMPDETADAGSSGAFGSGGKSNSAGQAGSGSAGKANQGGSGSSSGAPGSGGRSGAAAGANAGGVAGANAGGAAGAAVAGSANASGASGGTTGAVDKLLSSGKAVTADSEQTSKGNLAPLGNDGSLSTRWCASDGAVGHYWTVDLGAIDTLSQLKIDWEKAAIYKFKVEGSSDNASWSMILDQANSTNGSAEQTFPLPMLPRARWVRITVTGLATTSTWASFFEFGVYGH